MGFYHSGLWQRQAQRSDWTFGTREGTAPYWPVKLDDLAPFLLSLSSNIAASGANTTAQLTAPASGAFGGGRIQDDENLTDPVNLATNDYREDEWSIVATEFTVDAAVYEFRVVLPTGTPLTTYTVTPEWTVSASSPATINLAAVTMPLVAPAVTFTAGAVAMALAATAIPLVVPATTFNAGAVAIALAATPIPLVVVTPTFNAGAVTVSLDATSIPIVVPTPSLAPGGVTQALAAIPIPIDVPAVTFVVGAVALALAAVEVPIAVPTPSFTAVATVVLAPVPVPIELPAVTFVPGAVDMALAAVPVPIDVPTPALTPGAVSILIDPIAIQILAITPLLLASGGLATKAMYYARRRRT